MIQSQGIRAGSVTALVLLLLSPATLHAQTPPHYTVELLCNETGASDIDLSGVVVGSSTIGDKQRGWVVSHGEPLAPLPLHPGRISSWTRGINDLGVIVGAVGSSYSPVFSGVAAVWMPNGSDGYTVQELGVLPGRASGSATAINSMGDVVGWSSSSPHVAHRGRRSRVARLVPNLDRRAPARPERTDPSAHMSTLVLAGPRGPYGRAQFKHDSIE